MKAFLLSLFLCSIAIQANSQVLKELANSTPETRAMLFSSEILKTINLDEKQTKELKEINLIHAKSIIPILSEKSNRIAKLKKIKALDKKRDTLLASIFNQEQLVTYQIRKKELIQRVRLQLKAKLM